MVGLSALVFVPVALVSVLRGAELISVASQTAEAASVAAALVLTLERHPRHFGRRPVPARQEACQLDTAHRVEHISVARATGRSEATTIRARGGRRAHTL